MLKGKMQKISDFWYLCTPIGSRPYYWNQATKESRWENPLISPSVKKQEQPGDSTSQNAEKRPREQSNAPSADLKVEYPQLKKVSLPTAASRAGINPLYNASTINPWGVGAIGQLMYTVPQAQFVVPSMIPSNTLLQFNARPQQVLLPFPQMQGRNNAVTQTVPPIKLETVTQPTTSGTTATATTAAMTAAATTTTSPPKVSITKIPVLQSRKVILTRLPTTPTTPTPPSITVEGEGKEMTAATVTATTANAPTVAANVAANTVSSTVTTAAAANAAAATTMMTTTTTTTNSVTATPMTANATTTNATTNATPEAPAATTEQESETQKKTPLLQIPEDSAKVKVLTASVTPIKAMPPSLPKPEIETKASISSAPPTKSETTTKASTSPINSEETEKASSSAAISEKTARASSSSSSEKAKKTLQITSSKETNLQQINSSEAKNSSTKSVNAPREQTSAAAKNGTAASQSHLIVSANDDDTISLGVKELSKKSSTHDKPKEFKKLLKEKVGDKQISWESAFPIIVKDKRFMSIKSLDEKKRLFAKYVSKHKKEVPVDKKTPQDEFIEMLMENYMNGTILPTEKCRQTYSMLLVHDPRLSVSESERDALWDIFVKKVEQLKKKNQEKKASQALKEFSSILEKEKKLIELPWIDVMGIIKQSDCLKDIKIEDALELYLKERNTKEIKEETEKMIEKDKEEKTKRSARANFAALLYELADKEQLNIDSTWGKIKPAVENDPRYKAIPSSDAKKIFFSCLEELEHKYKKQKKGLWKMSKYYKVDINENLSVDDFINIISFYQPQIKSIPKINIKIFLIEILEKKRLKKLKKEKKAQKKSAKEKSSSTKDVINQSEDVSKKEEN